MRPLTRVAPNRVVLLAPTPERIEDILADLQACHPTGASAARGGVWPRA